jgi:hypothetical protein
MQVRLGIALILGAAFLAPAVGRAAWSANPVTVHATTDHCPLVAAASDAQNGAIVVWQQNSGSLRPFLAKHLLASGDVDPAWPAAGASVTTATGGGGALGALSDDSGGAYVWWLEGPSFYLTHMLTNGTIASGWPARGKLMGSLFVSEFGTVPSRPQVFPDGQGGVWAGWLSGARLATLGRIYHLGPDGLGAGGWPTTGRAYAVSGSPDLGLPQTLGFAYAPAPDGGAWVAWVDAPYDSAFHAGSCRLLRVNSSSNVVSGWPGLGKIVSTFHGELLSGSYYEPSPYYGECPVAVASDGAAGAYLLRYDVYVDSYYGTVCHPLLARFDSIGARPPSWPSDRGTHVSGFESSMDHGPECSLRLFPEEGGGVFMLRPSYFSEGGSSLTLTRFTPTGSQTAWASSGTCGFECIVSPNGETWLADYWPVGRQGPFSPSAELALMHTRSSGQEGPGYWEYHDVQFGTWYGDIGLAPAQENDAIFVWSQETERFGIFAQIFGDTPVPTLVESFRAVPVAEGVRIEWRLSDAGAFQSVELERGSSETGPWTRVEQAPRTEGDVIVVLDEAAPAGETTWYRLSGVQRDGRPLTLGLTSATAQAALTAFALAPLLPNPSAGRSLVTFTMPTRARVRLTLADVQGREVARLAEGPREAGRYTVPLDATSLRAGLYFVRLQAPGVSLTRRLVVVK